MSDVPLLEACGLRKVYADTVAVDDVSLSVSASRPSFTALAGESGSGKT
ncbi:MAG: ABC transporter ATP-binding protein, partial [Gemmatimonadetes bacterium]|nr:ABC transporter ATP-binding protein [Gemmatimonadota bacterium]